MGSIRKQIIIGNNSETFTCFIILLVNEIPNIFFNHFFTFVGD